MKTETMTARGPVGDVPDLAEAANEPSAALPARRLIIAASLGNALELFDFTVYSFFAALIGKLFFPVGGTYASLMLSFATFGIGFVVRPLGGVLLGIYADRVGRKAAMTLTIMLMAAGTAIIGLTPTYADIGLAAPVLIVLGRLLQGFSAGGEVGATMTFLMESASARRRGYLVSWQMAGQGASALAGAFCGVVLTQSLSTEALETWGWRVPFLLGLLIGPVGLYIRRNLKETLVTPVSAGPGAAAIPTPSARLDARRLLLGVLIMIGGTSTMYTMVFYLPSYLVKVVHLAPATALMSGCVAGLVLMFGSPAAGRLADRLGRRKPVVVVASMLSLLAILPVFALILAYPGPATVVPGVALMVGLMTLAGPSGSLLLLEGFAAAVRVRSLAIIYSVGVSVFGGFAPFIVTWAIRVTGSPYAPVAYMAACSALSVLALLAFRERQVD